MNSNNSRKKYDIDNGLLIKRETLIGTKSNTKEEKIQQDFFGHWDPKQHTEQHSPKTQPNRTKLKSVEESN